ncbi:hypothetical protein [Halorubrum persicum]|uniref:hypothetical protein n=1 Tax=Halorubrum persicum TaxID=1383844 RepID=UPI0011818A2E|nr:hypothetical protein [Halorubrum persicum]
MVNALPACSSILFSLFIILLIVVATIVFPLAIYAFIQIWRRNYFVFHSLQIAALKERIVQGGFSEVRSLYRKTAGQKVFIFLGFSKALLLGVAGFFLGTPFDSCSKAIIFSNPPINFGTGNLETLWQVHATVISLSLVGLGFAWESLRDLSTRNEIIAELTRRFGSVETIAFLFTSNVLIGLAVLLENQMVRPKITFTVSLLFVASLWLAASRFWRVFDVLLFNSLDDKVAEFAEEELGNMKSRIQLDLDDLLLDKVPGFQPTMLAPPTKMFSPNPSNDTRITAGDIGKSGNISDINIEKMRIISERLDANNESPIRANPLIGRRIQEDSTIFVVEENLSQEDVEEITDLLRDGIRTRREEQ